jgi:predicted Na+-dependent transporter
LGVFAFALLPRMPHKVAMSLALLKCASAPVRALAWLGRQGTRAAAALVFIGILVPPLGEALKPLVSAAIFLLLCISFMRVDLAALRRHLRRPGLVIAATAWTMLGVPLIVGVLALATGLNRHSPDVFLGLMLQAVASPMMAAPAFAALMNLDATLVLITLVAGTALVPFTAPLFAYWFFGDVLALSPLALGARLFEILAGSLLVAAVIRRLCGIAAIERHREEIDGINILLMLVFVTAVMGTVAGSFLVDPLWVIGLVVFAFALFFALLGLTVFVFRQVDGDNAFALGLMVAQRNIGLMLAVTESALPGTTWLFFALSQFPIYVSPQLLRPIARPKAGRLGS